MSSLRDRINKLRTGDATRGPAPAQPEQPTEPPKPAEPTRVQKRAPDAQYNVQKRRMSV